MSTLELCPRSYAASRKMIFVRYDEFFVNSSLIIIIKLHIFKNDSCWSMSVDWYSDELIVEELERLFPYQTCDSIRNNSFFDETHPL